MVHPDELFLRLKTIWDRTNGHYLGLLDVLCRLATDALTRDSGHLIQERLNLPAESADATLRAYSKRLKEHSVLLRRLVRIAGLSVDYKALVGPGMLGDEAAQGRESNSQIDIAYAEICRVVERDNLSSLAKLAARIPGVSVAHMYKAYTEKVLTGLDPLLLGEEARMDAENRLSHRLFVVEPYMEKVGAVALASVVGSLCRTGKGGWAGVQERINLVDRALQIVGKTESRFAGIISLRKSLSSESHDNISPQEQLKRWSKFLRLLEKLEGAGVTPNAMNELQALWNRGEHSAHEFFTGLIKDGNLSRPDTIKDLLDDYAMSVGSDVSAGEDMMVSLYATAVLETLKDLQMGGKPESLSSLRRTLTAMVDNERLWSQVAPIVQSFISDEGSEDCSGASHHARSEVLMICADLERPLVPTGVGSSDDVSTLLAFNKAATLLSNHFQLKVSRKQLTTWEGKLQVFQGLLPAAQNSEGHLRALLALVIVWIDPSSVHDMEAAQSLPAPYSRWLKSLSRRWPTAQASSSMAWVPLEDEGMAALSESERTCWRWLVEAALRGGHIALVSELLVGGSWRYAEPPLLDEPFETAVVAHLETIDAPVPDRLKVG